MSFEGRREREELIEVLKCERDAARAEEIRAKLREMIPATVEVWDCCTESFSVVVAAPHVSFDGWTEFFCNRVFRALNCGRVVAKNFRDDNDYDIPVSIGRHLHVNRPTESRERGGVEFESRRAREACEKYLAALRKAGRRDQLDLLIEVHGHHRHGKIEIATTGIDASEAGKFRSAYLRTSEANVLPQLMIEPSDKLYFSAENAKRNGSLQSNVTKRSLHIEIPKLWRNDEQNRERLCNALCEVLKESVASLKSGEAF